MVVLLDRDGGYLGIWMGIKSLVAIERQWRSVECADDMNLQWNYGCDYGCWCKGYGSRYVLISYDWERKCNWKNVQNKDRHLPYETGQLSTCVDIESLLQIS